jgi:HEAT repeat protein
MAQQAPGPGSASAQQIDALLRQLKAPYAYERADALEGLVQRGPAAVQPLIGCLSDRDWAVREAAAKALGRLKDARAVEPLLGCLNDVSWQTRRAAALALGQLGNTRAGDALARKLKDEDWTVRQAAAQTLGLLGAREALDPLVTRLADEKEQVRRAAATALGKLQDERALKPLLGCLDSQDGSLREQALEALGHLGQPAVGPLLDRLTDPDSAQQRLAARALAKVGAPAAEALIGWLQGPNEEQRQAAADVLAQLGQPAIKPLSACLSHSDADVRRLSAVTLEKLGWKATTPGQRALFLVAQQKWDEVATLEQAALEALSARKDDARALIRARVAETLGKLGTPQAADLLTALLQDKDPQVRWHAANGLGILHDKRSLKPLIACLQDPDPDVRHVAARGLGRLKDLEALDSLIAALSDKADAVACAAAESLGRFGGQRAVEPLLGCLERPQLGLVCAEALGRLRDRRALQPLLRCLRHADQQTRLAAIEALGELGDPQAAEPIHALSRNSDESEYVRRTAVLALGKLGDKRAIKTLVPYVSDGEAHLRDQAIEALGHMGQEAIEQLVQGLAHRKPTVRKNVASALAKLGYRPRSLDASLDLLFAREAWDEVRGMGEAAIRPLLARLKHPEPQLRQKAVGLLGQLDYTPVTPRALVDMAMARQQEDEIRKLGQAAVVPLAEWLGVRDSKIRTLAANLLSEFGYQPATDRDRAQFLVARQEWSAVEELGPLAVESLAACLEDRDLQVVRRAVELLGKLGDQRAAPYLAANLLPDWKQRRNLHATLTKLGWQPSTEAEQVYWRVAGSDYSWLGQHWQMSRQVLLADLRAIEVRKVEHAAYALIELGRKEAILELIAALNRIGTKEMAETFHNCGHEGLAEAAERWAAQHGGYFSRGPGAHEAFWPRWPRSPVQ